MKGGFGCSPCCGPTCEECTRECQNPHTGDPFETKYTLYFEGVEIGNPGGVYLQASGDVDTSDPYDGMDGNGPWSQTVSSVFTLSPTSSRIPCVFRASFWRSNFVLGASTVPPPATTLITNEITITNEASSEGAILYGDLVLQPGESHTITGSIPVVSGAGDQSTNDPRSAQGSVSISAACGNHAVSFSVSATISWDVKKRQHVLYGLVRECYEDPDNPNPPCATFCDGDPPPDVLYLTISNYTGPDFDSGCSGVNGTYVCDRVPQLCNSYAGFSTPCCQLYGVPANYAAVNPLPGWFPDGIGLLRTGPIGGTCKIVLIHATGQVNVCGTGVVASGSGSTVLVDGTSVSGTFDWEVSV